MTRITVYPAFNAYRYGFYLLGLAELFPASAIRYSSQDFPPFHRHCLAFVLRQEATTRRFYISCGDGTGLSSEALEWADVVGKVNLTASLREQDRRRCCFPIGPGFPVRAFGVLASVGVALRTLRAMGPGVRNGILGRHLADFAAQYRHRVPISAYVPSPPSDGSYCFYAAAQWPKEPSVNAERATFIRACRLAFGDRFEGGLFARSGVTDSPVHDVEIKGRYSMRSWLDRTASSAVCLVTPGMQGALTPKLGEYLALGKAIVMTPSDRELPAPLENGVHVHHSSADPDALASAVMKIAADKAYRRQLEIGARAYYDAYLAPARVLTRMLSFPRVDGPSDSRGEEASR